MLIIRFAEVADAENIFQLSNDEAVRKMSINKEKIAWNQHIKWFQERIEDIAQPFYIIENENKEFISQVRFNKNNEGYIISISITENFRGRGLAAEIIKMSCYKLNQYPIIAYINPRNFASK